MRSVRLSDELDERVRDAAAAEGETVSEFLRRAASERAERVLSERPSDRLAGVIGAVRSEGGRARRSGDAFADALAARRRER